MIRVAAVADVHFHLGARGRLRPALEDVADRADLLLIGGDLTCFGTVQEAEVFAEELDDMPIPTAAVLGNHDFHSDMAPAIAGSLGRIGVRVLEGSAVTVDVGDVCVGVAGHKGFGGGFAGASGSEFGEPEMKAFVSHTRAASARLRDALAGLAADVRIALLHYAPVADTLEGERREIYPFLGSHLLGDAIDEAGADLVVHGHAHAGVEEALTAGGIPVRNVAQPVLQAPVAVYEIHDAGDVRRAA
jgi:Icc-related predicted phosphoesterase